MSEATDLLARDFQDYLRSQLQRLLAVQRRERHFLAAASLSASASLGLLVNELSQPKPFSHITGAALIVFVGCLAIAIATLAAVIHSWRSTSKLRKELLGE